MALFKCKMCGGNLQISENTNIATCEYCGTNQTISKSRDDVITNLYNRANDLRIKCEFDRAEQIYEKILEQDNTEAEAHWGIVLCRFGIEYVKDPKTEQMIPTCHRTSYESVITDADYLSAIKYGDNKQKEFYISEAEIIDKIQKKALDIVRNEDPFDVFICYKETDENGKRTVDSTLANDIYYQLTQEGYKVFYAPITLEDKIGKEYEPYIFAALNSAKVMLVLGTKPEYFSAVWVKNEWSRYLKLIKEDRSKLLIPCYRDMNAYDLPDEFAHLQAQDMSKIGFIQDLIRGIQKLYPEKSFNSANGILKSELKLDLNKKSLENKKANFFSTSATIISFLLAVFRFFSIDIKYGYNTALIFGLLSGVSLIVLGIVLITSRNHAIISLCFFSLSLEHISCLYPYLQLGYYNGLLYCLFQALAAILFAVYCISISKKRNIFSMHSYIISSVLYVTALIIIISGGLLSTITIYCFGCAVLSLFVGLWISNKISK